MPFQKGHNYGQLRRKVVAWEVNENGCWVCTSHSYNEEGYPTHRVDGKRVRISHTMYEKYKGKIPDGLWILHSCDNPNCINPEHLFLGTNLDNVRDMIAKNRHSCGEKHSLICRGNKRHNQKLTAKEASEIKYGCKDMLQKEISAKYGITRSTILRIRSNVIWKYV